MIWTLDTLEQVLELYKKQRLLWCTKDSKHFDKAAREVAFQKIASALNSPNINGHDICRKLRTMRAAYQVEMRNITTANLRGFFYKPTLKWFALFKKVMDEIEEMKSLNERSFEHMNEISYEEEEGIPNTYVLKLNSQRSFSKRDKLHAQIVIPQSKPTPKTMQASRSEEPQILIDNQITASPIREDVFTEDSDDEFQMFADHIAEQLRTMPIRRAVMIQNQIQRIFAKDRHFNEGRRESMAESAD